MTSPPVIPAEAGIQSVTWRGYWAKLASLGQVRGGLRDLPASRPSFLRKQESSRWC
ncbi:MAG: hypothetical protein OXR07_06170 [Nitrospira sp.]|nr:hypothetical protein [Nitrospira sp.]